MGWMKLHRQMLTWEWFGDSRVLAVFVYLLLKANHALGRWQGIEVLPGQHVTSVAKIAEATGLNDMQVRRVLDKLKKSGEINVEATSKFSLVTIVKWGLFQDGEHESDKQTTNKQQTKNEQIANKQQTADKQTATNKNENNYKNDDNDNTYSAGAQTLYVCNADDHRYIKFRNTLRAQVDYTGFRTFERPLVDEFIDFAAGVVLSGERVLRFEGMEIDVDEFEDKLKRVGFKRMDYVIGNLDGCGEFLEWVMQGQL